MEEKVLIKSFMDKNIKNAFLASIISFFVLFGLLLMYLLSPETESWYYRGMIRFKLVFYQGVHLASFIIMCVFFLFALTLLVVYLAHAKCELIVTEKNVRGKTLFGKEVVLPIDMVSAYSMSSFMSMIAVATASGVTKFFLIKNYAQIGDVLTNIINQRNLGVEPASRAQKDMNTPDDSTLEYLVKLKKLVDQGVVTQEEFEAKKKELLGV